MKKLLLLSSFVTLVASVKAQFPTFTDFEGHRYYTNKNQTDVVARYLKIFNFGNTVDSWTADHCRNSLTGMVDAVDKAIDSFRNINNPSKATNDALMALQDSLSFLKDARDFYLSINKFTGKPKLLWAGICPVWRASEAKFFYQNSAQTDTTQKNFNFLSSFVIQSNINKTAISSDLLSGAVWLFKLKLSTTVVDNSDTSNIEKVSNKLAYGGLINGQLEYPLLYCVRSHFAIYIPLTFVVSFDNVGVNKDAEIKKSFYFTETAASAYIRIPVINTNYQVNNASIFANAMFGYIDGGPSFYDKLDGLRHGFWMARASLGVELNSKLRLAFSFPLYASEKKIFTTQNGTVGIQIDPKLLIGK